MKRPCVLLPVFNAREDLQRCLGALDATLGTADRVLVLDDASTDPSIWPLVQDWVAETPLQARAIRQPQNLGFVRTVNQGIGSLHEQDVILLNSDTQPAHGWMEAMVACVRADPRIATATPWSNNAEICSFPELCVPAPMPSHAELLTLGRMASLMANEEAPDLPTGVGFAMFVRGRAWRLLGGFDADTFGRGYGEENDFCLRAAAHGWRNVLAPGAYVAHRGHASFAETGHRPGGENLLRLLARYPDYNRLVAEFILQDPLRPLRERMSDLMQSTNGSP